MIVSQIKSKDINKSLKKLTNNFDVKSKKYPTYEFPKYEIKQIILKAQISKKLKLSNTVTNETLSNK